MLLGLTSTPTPTGSIARARRRAGHFGDGALQTGAAGDQRGGAVERAAGGPPHPSNLELDQSGVSEYLRVNS